ncbi:helix-turn-helix domain-containing protein [Natrinema thermotolerans]|uniref:Helix-turn-helix domain-containing protein n=1 Tax=Natrinema thermotolerans TaxID=121872 RepID=A0AAF0PCG5_9EURY|nr:helix-turn-helix domain-containing protein [Natrinema thermotolerans]QCC59935.1 ArsR family transcriptional regulator [Natrinema thermotolerans]WMT06939.1 helix-turn-helix domain-containing protein [Natrinema thermotolerans]
MSLEFSSSDETPGFECVIAALDDCACREIIAILEEPMTVEAIAEATDCPLSTTYRKLDCLTEAGLAEEAVGVREGRHRKARYVANLERISIGLDEDNELRVDVEYASGASIWSELQGGH